MAEVIQLTGVTTPNTFQLTGGAVSQQIVATGAVAQRGEQGLQGIQGEKGDPGTTDYNELTNLPDLSLKADKSDSYTKTEVDTKDNTVASTAQTNLAIHTSNTSNPHNVTKAQVGLGNVPNTDFTSDVSANTAARHTHSNKAILDATTASFNTAKDTKLTGIATGATANATDAQLRDRTTHTGTQAVSTVAGLQGVLDGKANAVDPQFINNSSASYIIVRGVSDGYNLAALELSNTGLTRRWQFAVKPNGMFGFSHFNGTNWADPFSIGNDRNVSVVGNINMNNKTIDSLATPTSNNQAATKGYIDTKINQANNLAIAMAVAL